ncbi:MAG TPA: PQQ-dependent sugar dehydrogenase [Candidatus Limnocylindrales bacterium]|nr:PQQ-dependent sugar dehydrogenase [Candidatus Limnocylindrales bacterium]
MHRLLAALFGALLAATACTATVTPSPTPGASPTAPPPSPTPRISPPPTAVPTPSPTPAPPFDPTAVSISLEAYATVPGGPLAITAPHDGSGRLLVATKLGQVRIVRDGVLEPDPMLDIADLVSGGGEQGLLGLAVHPDFPDDPRVVVDYTNRDGDTVVASYALDPGNPDRLDPATATTILAIDQPYANHTGGAVAFGPDGYLYVALGDGGSGGDPQDHGERLDTLLGKILRVDIDGVAPGRAYAVPTDNPFVDVAGARPEIWLTGFRNPWRFSFDRLTGDLWIGDVGQNAFEEVDVAPAGVGGLDFGWDRREGAHCFEPETGCPTAGLIDPVTEYGHEDGCTIIGGAVYRGAAQPLLAGGYVFGDYCTGRLWAIPADVEGAIEPVRVGTGGFGLAGFGEDEAGELYAANLDGTISRLVATAR